MTTTSTPPPPSDGGSTTLDPGPDLRTEEAPTGDARRTGGGFYRAFWRWHFYASVLVIPIMLMLAVTGLAILYKWQLDPAFHPGVITVDAPGHGAARPLSEQEAAARAAFPEGRITAVQQGAENRATFFTMALGAEGTDGERNVYVDPFTATVTGSLDPDHLPSNIATEIHGKIIFGGLSDVAVGTDPLVTSGLTRTDWSDERMTLGKYGDRIIELAACWALVMTITGYYLYLRGRTARLRRIAASATGARLRNNHARIGAIFGAGFLLLVGSGLPWTGLWGDLVQRVATGQGSSLWGEDPGAESTLGPALVGAGSNANPAPWAEGAAPLPRSEQPAAGGGHAGHQMGGASSGSQGSVNIDQVITAARADGMPEPYYVLYPSDERGVFSVLADQWHDKAAPAFTDTAKERTVHVDQYSGQVIGRYAYADYSVAAKAVSQGIALHEGRRLGSANLVWTTAFCLGVIFLCVSGPLMWWKRRPSGGGLAAPRGRMPIRTSRWLAVGLVALGVLMPLFGLSLLLVLAFDALLVRRSARLRDRLNSVPAARG